MRASRRVLSVGARALVALGLVAASGCLPRPRIVAPADQGSTGLDGATAIEVDFGRDVAPGSYRVTLLRGIDAPPAAAENITGLTALSGGVATGTIPAEKLAPGRNALYATLDTTGDGVPEFVLSSVFRWDPLRAAACRRVITPVVGVNHSDPIFMAGFGNDRQATGVHDDIWARGYVLQSAAKKIAVVTLDVIGYFNNEIVSARQDPVLAGLGLDAIVVTSTHTHEGPDTLGLWGPDETSTGVDLGYLDFVNAQIAQCIADAHANLRPAEIRFATGSTVGTSLPPYPDLVADGHVLQALVIPADAFDPVEPADVVVQGDPGEIHNPSVPVLQIRDAVSDGVIATVVNYASHPESLGSNNKLLSSDFPHYMREALEARYGGVAIYQSADLGVLQGPLDVDVTDPATGQPAVRRSFRFAQVMGEKLAERAQLALDGVASWDANPALDARSSGRILVRVENPFFLIAAGFGVFGRRPIDDRDEEGKRAVSSEAAALRIGPAQLAVTPNELDPQIGNDYRDRMEGAEHRWVLGLGNDELGYQMPAAKFNPSCHECAVYVAFGNTAECPIAQALGEEAVDCSTVFINNIGPRADPQLQGYMETLLDELNAP